MLSLLRSSSFFFNGAATPEIYTLSLHDALPILRIARASSWKNVTGSPCSASSSITSQPYSRLGRLSHSPRRRRRRRDRKSTRLNSSHVSISYAVFCLKKKKNPSHCP